MTIEDLQILRDWADAKVNAGRCPWWAWYQYVKLREALDGVIAATARAYQSFLCRQIQKSNLEWWFLIFGQITVGPKQRAPGRVSVRSVPDTAGSFGAQPCESEAATLFLHC